MAGGAPLGKDLEEKYGEKYGERCGEVRPAV